MSPPLFFNYPISEIESSASAEIRFLLTALAKGEDLRLRTTLLGAGGPGYGALKRARVLSVLKNDQLVQVEPQIRPKDQTTDEQSRLWKDHLLRSIGSNGKAPAVSLLFPAEQRKPTSIERWVEESAAVPVIDPFTAEPKVNLEDPSEAKDFSTEAVPRPATRRPRTAKGNPKVAIVSAQAENAYATQDILPSVSQNQAQSPIRNQHANPEDRHHRAKDDSTSAEASYSPRTPTIKPPDMPAKSSASLHSATSSNWESQVVRSSQRTYDLIDISAPSGPVQKGLQDITNTGFRTPRQVPTGILIDINEPVEESFNNTRSTPKETKHTMRQRKAPGILVSDTALLKSFEAAVLQLLTLGWARSHLKLEVNIGRLFFRQVNVSAEFKKKSFSLKDFSLATSGLEVIFTDMLTRRSLDADFILAIKLSQGRNLFVEEPCARTVMYNIVCEMNTNTRITIEVDEGGAFQIRGSEHIIGALNWHFPKRSWDARLALTSHKCIDKGHWHQHAQKIVNDLKLFSSSSSGNLELSTHTPSQEHFIQSITLRRETVHASTMYPDMLLHLTEVQDLGVFTRPTQTENSYSGSILPHKNMVSADRLWWEVSLSSLNVTAKLNEKDRAQCGRHEIWSPESVLDNGAVGDMSALAQEIVMRIDRVGAHNKGSGDQSTPSTSEKAPEIPPGPWNFW